MANLSSTDIDLQFFYNTCTCVLSTINQFFIACFMSDHQTFCRLFKDKWHFNGCINHTVYVFRSLCSELLMGLSCHSHLAYGDNKKLSPLGNRTQDLFNLEPLSLPLDQGATNPDLLRPVQTNMQSFTQLFLRKTTLNLFLKS